MKKKALPIVVLSVLFGMTALTGCNEEEFQSMKNDYQEQIDDLQEQIDDIHSEITKLKSDMTASINEVKADYQAKIDLANGEIDDLEAALEALTEKHNSELASLQQSFAADVSTIQSNISTQSAAITALQEKHEQDVQSLKSDYEAKLASQEAIDVAARLALKGDYEQKLAALGQSEQEAREALEADYLQKLAEQEATDVAARKALEDSFNASLASLNEELVSKTATLQTSINANVTKLNDFISQYNTDKAEIEQNFEDAVTQVTSSLATINANISTLQSQMSAEIIAIQNDYIEKINALKDRVSDLEEVPTHTVTFVVEGDNPFSFEPQIVKHGEKATKPEFLVIEGYNFPDDNIFYADTGYGKEPWYFMGASVTEDITLYATADAYSYEIQLDENYPGGQIYTYPELISSGHSFELPVPIRDGYVFEGWYAMFGDQVTDENGMCLEPFNFATNLSLMAYWEESSGGGTETDPLTVDEARQYINEHVAGAGQLTAERIVVGGIVASKTDYNETYGTFSIYFQNEDGTDEKYFQAYHVKLGNDMVYSDIQQGWYVIVEGYGQIYNGSQFELCPDGDVNFNPTTVYSEYRAPVLKGIKLDDRSVREGSNITLSVTPIPSYATSQIVDPHWESDSSHIEIGYFDGIVYGISEGEAEVTVTVGEFTASCTINVLPEGQEEYTITINPSDFEAATSAAISQTISGITFTVSNGTVGSDQMRIFKEQTLTIAIDAGAMTKIEMTCTASGTDKYGPGCFVSADGNYTYAGTIGTWTGYKSSASFTASSNQVRVTSFKITFIQ